MTNKGIFTNHKSSERITIYLLKWDQTRLLRKLWYYRLYGYYNTNDNSLTAPDGHFNSICRFSGAQGITDNIIQKI